MYVRLTCKLAEIMEGVDLSSHAEGDIIQLSDHDGRLLLMGGWAQCVDDERVRSTPLGRSAIAADRPSS
jgi:hypothetical protein